MTTLNFWTCPKCGATNGQPDAKDLAAGKVECRACSKVLRIARPNETTEATRWHFDR